MKSSKLSYFIFFAMVGLVIWAFINPFWRDYEIGKNVRYSIATVYKLTGSLKNGEQYHYRFNYKGKNYEGLKSKSKKVNVKFGDMFAVEFSSRRPDVSTLRYEYPIKKEYKQAPDSGWRSMPDSIIERYWIIPK